MNRIDINEIRRGLHPDRTSADVIRGCYVDERGEIISMFTHSLVTLPEEEGEKYLALFRKVLSGVPGKNLVEIPFRPDQVAEGEEHRLLTAMKEDTVTLSLGSLENTVVIARWAVRSVENVATENDSSMPEV